MTYPKGTARPSNVTGASDTASTTDMSDQAAEAEAEVEASETSEGGIRNNYNNNYNNNCGSEYSTKNRIDKECCRTIRDISASIRDTVRGLRESGAIDELICRLSMKRL